MQDLQKQVWDLMLGNRRIHQGYQYTIPSPQTYPYQWLWDSCFHAIILSYFDTKDAQKELLSLTSKQFENGMIPHMIYWEKESATDFPVIEWGKENTSTIIQPPMLAYAAWQIYQKDQDKDFVTQIYPSLVRFFNFLLSERDPYQTNLISLINPDESGEDNSPRFDVSLGLPPKHDFAENFQRRLKLVEANKRLNFNSYGGMKNFLWVKDVPINAILAENLKIMSDLASLQGLQKEASDYLNKKKKIELAMREMMLEDKVFWSVYLNPRNNQYEKIKVKTWAIFSPLFAEILTKEEADYLIEHYLVNSNEFTTPFMVPTVSCSDPSFNPADFWRGPVWIAVNWFIVKGLQNYGYFDLAKKIVRDSQRLLEKFGFREYFNPYDGSGMGAHDFTWGGLILDMQEIISSGE